MRLRHLARQAGADLLAKWGSLQALLGVGYEVRQARKSLARSYTDLGRSCAALWAKDGLSAEALAPWLKAVRYEEEILAVKERLLQAARRALAEPAALCPCGRLLNAGQNYCGYCGRPRTAWMGAPLENACCACGVPLATGARFCRACEEAAAGQVTGVSR